MKNKNAIKMAIVSVVATFYSIGAYATNYQGKVSGIITGSDIVYFNIQGAVYNPCATNQRYVIDTRSNFGKNTYSLILSAYMAGKPVLVIPTGQCNTLPGDAEDIYNAGLP